MWPAVKKPFTQAQFSDYVSTLPWGGWRPSLIVWHNTAAPTLAQWMDTAKKDEAKGAVPGSTRINNLERYFRVDRGWSGSPHLFIAPDFIWVFNPLTSPGVHSPSWNSRSIGIEMIGDYEREDPDSGLGLQVKNHTIFATAILCEAIGLDPDVAIKIHREDPKTTHACPGIKIVNSKFKMLQAVKALLTGGEHSLVTPPLPNERTGIVTTNGLNVRSGPGVGNQIVMTLNQNDLVTIIDEAKNGTTSWLRVRVKGGDPLWVAARYVQLA